MKLPLTQKERILKSPYYVGRNLWSKLDAEIQVSSTMECFKYVCKKLDIENMNYN